MSIEMRSRQYGKVFDHWQIREFLGSGSGGKTAVFRLARSDSDRGASALKVVNLIEERGKLQDLSPRRREEYEAVRQECSSSAEEEVWLMDDLRGNTNIVDYLDHTFVDWEDDTGFGRDMLIRMELLTDLRSQMRSGRAFTEKEILKIGRDICTALILCHRKNILHRDVKPENIFLNKDGNYKLGDFGVSRVLDACPGAMASTGIGTYEYWPAEQMSGRYDTRVDTYSLGLVLYELSNGNRLPFAASAYTNSREVSQRLSGMPLPVPCNASEKLAAVILKACAFLPEDRYASAEAFLQALCSITQNEQITSGQTITKKNASDIQTDKSRKNKVSGWIYAAVVFGLCMVSAGAMWLVMQDPDPYGQERLYSEETGTSQITEPADTVVSDAEIVYPEQQDTTEVTEETVEIETTVPPVTSEDIINILVLGQSFDNQRKSQLGNSTMLVSLNVKNSSVTIYSVLDDAYVKFPEYAGVDYGSGKFGDCANLGFKRNGMKYALEMTNICMTENFGVEVDYNFVIDTDDLVDIIDHLGGVELDLTSAEEYYLKNECGLKDVDWWRENRDGTTAVAYACMGTDGDVRRATRQCYLAEVLLEKVRGMSLAELEGLAGTLLPMITTTMSSEEIADVMSQVFPLLKDLKFTSETIPVYATYRGQKKDLDGDGTVEVVLEFNVEEQKIRISELNTSGNN